MAAGLARSAVAYLQSVSMISSIALVLLLAIVGFFIFGDTK